MARRLNAQRMILVMGVLVLGLGAASVWVLMHADKPAPQPTHNERAEIGRASCRERVF